MEEGALMKHLTTLFEDMRSAGEYISFKCWTGEGNSIKFFITNTPPKKMENSAKDVSDGKCSDNIMVPKPLPSQEHQSTPVRETRSKKRKVAEKSKDVTPEIIRSGQIDVEEMNVSEVDVEQSLSLAKPVIP